MTRNRHPQRPTPPTPTPPITAIEARQLGRELVTELAQHAGDPDAVRAVLNHWLETEDTGRLSLISMSAVQQVFSDYISRVPVDQIPVDALTLTAPTERTS